MASRGGLVGGGRQKNIGCKGVVVKRNLSSFAVTVYVVTKWATASKTSPNWRCFKLHHSYCNSFNLSNIGIFFRELNSKGLISRFIDNVNIRRRISLSLFKLEHFLNNSTPRTVCLHWTKWVSWDNRAEVFKNAKSLFKWRFRRRRRCGILYLKLPNQSMRECCWSWPKKGLTFFLIKTLSCFDCIIRFWETAYLSLP